ncbi:response regulator [Glaciecola sp. 1036]|uniref:hybrid sensor histidine kinase/response regulator n=1 Tax=Alteromonadaceae TaxID=72275 RepID=UPI003D00DEC4
MSLLVLLIFTTLFIIFFVFAENFIDQVENELGAKLLSQDLLITRERTLNYFNRDQKLIEFGLAADDYKKWMKNPDDELAKDAAIKNIKIICDLVNCYGWFMFSNQSLNGYDWNRKYNEIQTDQIILSRDSWYTEILSSGKQVYIMSSIHPKTQEKGVFFDYIVREQDKVIGLMGTYIYIDNIVTTILQRDSSSVTNLFVDEARVVRSLHEDNPQNELQNTLVDQVNNQNWENLLPATSIAQINEFIGTNAAASDAMYYTDITIEGKTYLLGALHVKEVDWIAISLFPQSLIQQKFDNVYLFAVAVLILLFSLLLTIFVIHREVFDPVSKLNQYVDAIHMGDFHKTIGNLGTDVMQNLGNRISHMAAHIAEQVEQLQEANNALIQATERANKANNAKSLFLSNMSHEMRTPLNAVLGFVQFAKEAKSPQELERYLRKIDNASGHLLNIINDLLDLNKIESGELELDHVNFNLNKVLRKVMNICQLKIQEKQLTVAFFVDPSTPVHLLGDSLRLEQILINLINNASKYTEKGSIHLVISGKKLDRKYASLSFSVIDTGIGMTPQQLSRIFKPFNQADASITRRFGGSGLGLTISKQLAQAMGGDITVLSKIGEGSTFTCRVILEYLEVAPEKIQQTLPESIPESELKTLAGKKLLLVEDNDINQEIAKGILAPLKLQIDVAVNGKQAVEMCENNAYDVVLMDIQMPEMDGLEATKLILKRAPETKVIGLSAHSTKEDEIFSMKIGMQAYLTKPIDKQKLFTAIYHSIYSETSTQI